MLLPAWHKQIHVLGFTRAKLSALLVPFFSQVYHGVTASSKYHLYTNANLIDIIGPGNCIICLYYSLHFYGNSNVISSLLVRSQVIGRITICLRKHIYCIMQAAPLESISCDASVARRDSCTPQTERMCPKSDSGESHSLDSNPLRRYKHNSIELLSTIIIVIQPRSLLFKALLKEW